MNVCDAGPYSHLAGPFFICFAICEQKTFCKSSLAEELAFVVSLHNRPSVFAHAMLDDFGRRGRGGHLLLDGVTMLLHRLDVLGVIFEGHRQ